MKFFRNLTFFIGISLLTFGCLEVSASAEAAVPRIDEMTVTTKIVRGNPIDSVHRISSASVKVLYCFTRVSVPDGEETSVKHVWYRDNQEIANYTLPVKGLHWRTYSRKQIEKGWAGDWHVDALDSEGHLLKTVRFRMN